MVTKKAKREKGTHFRAVIPADIKAIIRGFRDKQLKKGTLVPSDEKAVFELIRIANEYDTLNA